MLAVSLRLIGWAEMLGWPGRWYSAMTEERLLGKWTAYPLLFAAAALILVIARVRSRRRLKAYVSAEEDGDWDSVRTKLE